MPRWLIEKSALARAGKPVVAEVMMPRIDAGLLGICVVTELKVGLSARSTRDHDDVLGLFARLIPMVMPVQAERLAQGLQRQLVERGQHRALSMPDLLMAATAKATGLTVLHDDERPADVTLARPGSASSPANRPAALTFSSASAGNWRLGRARRRSGRRFPLHPKENCPQGSWSVCGRIADLG